MPKILVIKFGALGDVVMATSLIKQIQRFHGDSEVFLITSPAFTSVFEHWDDLSVIAFSRKGFLETIRVLSWIRKSGFNRIYDLQSNDRTSVICAFSGVKERIGNHPRFPYTHHPADIWTGQCHIFERMLMVLESAGIHAESVPPLILSNDKEKAGVREWMNRHHLANGAFVILHAGASSAHPEKCWPYFLELAQVIDQSGHSVVWVGAETEARENRQRAETVGIDASNAFSITGLAELGRHACFAVTNDSGPMHILSASGIPVYAFFGPTNWLRSHAIGQREHVIIPPGLSSDIYHPETLDKIKVSGVVDILRTAGSL
ncbi:MAG: hypothetical protein A2W76_10315 [Gammaproteobacteria bacterium RIFCSPLOWO2_12_47_11]|nr:MAG: hypothetical protein A2W76_10315 [Gammaproteobacteria bacterium RIFCSPLOWO2_12_47_11]